MACLKWNTGPPNVIGRLDSGSSVLEWRHNNRRVVSGVVGDRNLFEWKIICFISSPSFLTETASRRSARTFRLHTFLINSQPTNIMLYVEVPRAS